MIAILLATALACTANEAQSGVGARACYARQAAETDAEMVAQFALTLTALRRDDAETQSQRANRADMVPGLLASQKAWLAYRDAECDMVADQASGGNGGPAELDALCRVELNRQRTIDLKQRVESQLSPPAP